MIHTHTLVCGLLCLSSRLLFGREFALPSVLELWDALFANRLSLVDYRCVAMLMHIREVCESVLWSDGAV